MSDVQVGKSWYLNGGVNQTWIEDIKSGMRIVERVKLQRLLLSAVEERGVSIFGDNRFQSARKNGNGTLEVQFESEEKENVDLLVGADGGWSSARKHILREKYEDERKVEERQIPEFMGASGFYGISRCGEKEWGNKHWEDTHGVWLDGRVLSTSPLPDGRMRWDLQVPEKEPPAPVSEPREFEEGKAGKEEGEEWEKKIAAGIYEREDSIEVLRRRAGVSIP